MAREGEITTTHTLRCPGFVGGSLFHATLPPMLDISLPEAHLRGSHGPIRPASHVVTDTSFNAPPLHEADGLLSAGPPSPLERSFRN